MTTSLTSSPEKPRESIEKSLPDIIAILQKEYIKNIIPMSKEAAISRMQQMDSSIISVLRKNGVSV
jgi:hypothetical protein